MYEISGSLITTMMGISPSIPQHVVWFPMKGWNQGLTVMERKGGKKALNPKLLLDKHYQSTNSILLGFLRTVSFMAMAA